MAKRFLKEIPIGDLGLYFNSSYVRVGGLDKEPQWYLFAGFDENRSLILKQGMTKKLVLEKPEWMRKVWIDSVFPTGYFNYKDSAVYCTRAPVRQVTQGLNNHNFRMEWAESIVYHKVLSANTLPPALKNHFANMVGRRKLPFNAVAFNDMFESKKEYTRPDNAIDQIRRGAFFARAVSKHIVVVPHPTKIGATVLYDRLVVGISEKTKEITIIAPSFEEELKDVFKDSVTLKNHV